jgi:hypothetical protein
MCEEENHKRRLFGGMCEEENHKRRLFGENGTAAGRERVWSEV